MTIKTVTTIALTCDGTGPYCACAEARTIGFGIDGSSYEREACADCELGFAQDIEPFIWNARPASSAKRRRPASSRRRAYAIRQWAAGQGIALAGRGRISAEVVRRYEAEHRG